MKINLSSKRSKLIILVIFFVVFAGTGGYLLWRVNQPESVAPEDSDAGQASWGACWYCCREDEFKLNSKGEKYCPGGSLCPECKVTCGDGVTIRTKCQAPKEACVNCLRPAPGETEPIYGECSLGSQCNSKVKCYWPEVAYCGSDNKCTCRGPGSSGPGPNSKNKCTDVTPQCTPKCPSGYEVCTGSNCGTDTKVVECSHDCKSCTNRYWVKKTCKRIEQLVTNECDGGNWTKKPSGTYSYCFDISYKFVAKDSDGVKKSSIVVKLNDKARTNLTKSTIKEADKEVEVKETLSTSSNCLKPGEYTIKASWADTKDKTGPECSLTASFTVLEEVKNPDWDISKKVTEVCIDENTENPKSKLQYVVTITNSGEGAGKITSIVDTLDSKVLEEYIDSISANGKFQGGTIVWPVVAGDQEFNPGQSKTYTYSYVVPSTAFGVYNNTVKATPAVGNTLIANATISADCEVLEPEEEPVPDEEIPVVEEGDLPESGIFDDSQASILLGVGLLLLGFTWRILGRGMYVSVEMLGKIPKKISIHMKDVKEDMRARKSIKRMQKFEKKIVKK